MAIPIKSPDEVAAMRRVGRAVWSALRETTRAVEPGVTTLDIGRRAEAEISRAGLRHVLRGYVIGDAPPFPYSACVCVNEQVVHGVPGEREIRRGDIVTIDLAGADEAGWFADAATTVVLEGADATRVHAARVAALALRRAISLVRPGVRWSAIASDVDKLVTGEGCRLVSGYSGHGIGRALHEPPVAWFGRPARGVADVVLRPGMTLTVEPIVVAGGNGAPRGGASPGLLVTQDDGWTVVTADHAPAAHEERVVAVTRTGCEVLTDEAAGGN